MPKKFSTGPTEGYVAIIYSHSTGYINTVRLETNGPTLNESFCGTLFPTRATAVNAARRLTSNDPVLSYQIEAIGHRITDPD